MSLVVVSRRCGVLERCTGVRLVDRTTRSFSSTEEGRFLLAEVECALEAISQGEETLAHGRDEPVGTLRVSVPVSLGRRHVAPALGELARRHSQLSIALSLDDRLVDVLGGSIDAAIRIPSSTPHRKKALVGRSGRRSSIGAGMTPPAPEIGCPPPSNISE